MSAAAPPAAASGTAPGAAPPVAVPPPTAVKAHVSLSDRWKDRFSKFRHKDGLATDQPPSPLPSMPDCPNLPHSSSHAPQSSPALPPAQLKTSASATVPLSASASGGAPVGPYTSTLNLPPPAPQRPIPRASSSSPIPSPHHSTLSTSPATTSASHSSTSTSSTSSSSASSSSSTSAASVAIPGSPSLPSISHEPHLPTRPVVGRLHIRVVEGRNLGPPSASKLRTHLLTYFESLVFKSASFSGLQPFFGHSVTVDVTDVTNDVVIQVVEEHKLTKNAPIGQLITSLTSLLNRDLHPLARHFQLDEWIELYPANYDQGAHH